MKLYDDGYQACPCFWGSEPAELVKNAINLLKKEENVSFFKAFDFGCGEGKNISFAAKNGFISVGIDQSEYAISNALINHSDSSCVFLIGDMLNITALENHFHLVISTGSIHCLENQKEVEEMISKLVFTCKKGGYIVFSVFNNRSNDFSGHPSGFNPILLSHEFYVSRFAGLNILHESDQDLIDKHPNNNIEHRHSITRILARK